MNVPVWLRRRAGALAMFVLLFAVWEIGVRVLEIKSYLLPAPTKIWADFAKRADIVGSATLVTASEMLGGYLLAVAVSIPFALAVAYSRFLETSVYPVVVFLQIIPKIAIAPLFIIWFGFGMASKAIMAGVVAFFPILVNVITGLRSTDNQRIELMRSLRASRWQIFTMVRLPSAAPMIFAGFQIAIIFSVLGAIVGEFVGSRKGLGNLILQMNTNLDTAGVFAALVCLSAMGITLHLIMKWIQRRVLFWAEENRSGHV